MDAVTPDGSLDSIPRPKYEPLHGSSGKSTPLSPDEEHEQELEDEADFHEPYSDKFEYDDDADDQEAQEQDEEITYSQCENLRRAYENMGDFSNDNSDMAEQSSTDEQHASDEVDDKSIREDDQSDPEGHIDEPDQDLLDEHDDLIKDTEASEPDQNHDPEAEADKLNDMLDSPDDGDKDVDEETGSEEDKHSEQHEDEAEEINKGNQPSVAIILKKVAVPSIVESADPPPEASRKVTKEHLAETLPQPRVMVSPLHIVGAITSPKIVQAKTKNNQLIMVNLVNDNGKELVQQSEVTTARNKVLKVAALIPTKSQPPVVATSAKNVPATLTHHVEDDALHETDRRHVDEEELQATPHAASLTQKGPQRSNTPMSREILALQRSVNESMVLTKFVTDASDAKVRASRKSLAIATAKKTDTSGRGRPKGPRSKSNDPPPEQPLSPREKFPGVTVMSLEPDRPQSAQSREFLYAEGSPECSALKRVNMRSQNSEFVQKQMEFLNRLKSNDDDSADADSLALDEERDDHASVAGDEDDGMSLNMSVGGASGGSIDSQSASHLSGATEFERLIARMKVIWQPPPKVGWDSFCWKCRVSSDLVPCCKCVRSYHASCAKATHMDESWVCPECSNVENYLVKKGRRSELSVDVLHQSLAYALKRVKEAKGCHILTNNTFAKLNKLADHDKHFLVNLVTFETIEKKIETKSFRCVEDFVNEAKWILHNILIISSVNSSKEIASAKEVLKTCRTEANEIESCYECYLNSNTRLDWFVDVCSQPHLLLWAKLKGFPYWPAKAMGPGPGAHLVNVRFFGKHDRSSVPVKDCFLYSGQDPNPPTTGRRFTRELLDCIKEIEVHIDKIRDKVGEFRYAKLKTPYDPNEEMKQLESMIPGVREYIKRQQTVATTKPSLQYKIVKNNNNLKFVRKASSSGPAAYGTDQCSVRIRLMTPPPTETPPQPKELVESQPAASATVSPCSSRATNYEVISKIRDGEDGDTAKVNTVILKRKSVGSRIDEAVDHSTVAAAKAARLDETTSPNGSKRKHAETDNDSSASSGSEKHHHRSSKHSKHEPRIPPFTIKTNLPATDAGSTATVSINIWGTEEKRVRTSSKPKIPTVTIKTSVPKIVESSTPAAASASTSPSTSAAKRTTSPLDVVDVVKNMEGITIKKICRTEIAPVVAASPAEVSPESRAHVPVSAEGPCVGDNKQSCKNAAGIQEPTDNNSHSSNCSSAPSSGTNNSSTSSGSSSNATLNGGSSGVKKSPNSNEKVAKKPLIGLVPFVEIKQEVQSDEEDQAQQAVDPPAATVRLPLPCPLPLAVPDLGAVTIKQEAVSEDEATVPTPINTATAVTTSEPIVPPPVVAAILQSDPVLDAAAHAAINVVPAVVVGHGNTVGDTLIKPQDTASGEVVAPQEPQFSTGGLGNIGPDSTLTSVPSSRCTSATSSMTSPPSSMVASNENSLEPFGEPQGLLASRLQKSQKSAATQRCMPRARKTFLNRSSPVEFAGTAMKPVETHRSLLNATSMVAIPMDVANPRQAQLVPITAVPNTIASKSHIAIGQVESGPPPTWHGNLAAKPTLVGSVPPPPLVGLSNSSAAPSTVQRPVPMGPANLETVISSSLTYPPMDSSVAANTVTTCLLPAAPMLSTTSGEAAPLPCLAPMSSTQVAAAKTPPEHMLTETFTPVMAAAITDALVGGPPKLVEKPKGPLKSDGSAIFPSQAGPVSQKFMENAHKLTDFFISVMEDTVRDISCQSDAAALQAKNLLLQMELERVKQSYEAQLNDLKRSTDIIIGEFRKSAEKEKNAVVAKVRRQCELERLRAVEATKGKQWCATCMQEAIMYCCWNTSYCGYACQQMHWAKHSNDCTQTKVAAARKEAEAQRNKNTCSSGSAPAAVMQSNHVNEHNAMNRVPQAMGSSTQLAATSSGSKESKQTKLQQQQQQHQQQRQHAHQRQLHQQQPQHQAIVMPTPMPLPSIEHGNSRPASNTMYRVPQNGSTGRQGNYFVNGRQLNNNVAYQAHAQTASNQVARATTNWDQINATMRSSSSAAIATYNVQQQQQHQQQQHQQQRPKPHQQQQQQQQSTGRMNARQRQAMQSMRNQKM